jgi:hypothetical protein
MACRFVPVPDISAPIRMLRSILEVSMIKRGEKVEKTSENPVIMDYNE